MVARSWLNADKNACFALVAAALSPELALKHDWKMYATEPLFD
jgi:hypothetical protein